ncbi:MAG: AraC family transcriptional regulator [Kiritimatiellae bacterium]|nr:AraC family transcriptional regulator [Kiritimatiellia bacterium]
MMLTGRNKWTSFYRPPDGDSHIWGLSVVDAGFTVIAPGQDYPPMHHPNDYLFSWERGRCFSEYQFVAILEGRGQLETASGGMREVQAGDLFILAPNEWHRYRPDPETGWKEMWIGFKGDYANRLMTAFFPLREPVLRQAATLSVQKILFSGVTLYGKEDLTTTPFLAAKLIDLIAHLAAFIREAGYTVERRERQQRIAKLRSWIAEHAFGPIATSDLVRVAGMSDSVLRTAFKEELGCTLHTYIMRVRLSFAQMLLRQTDYTVSEIAERTGFTSGSYFTRFFVKRVGMSPGQWRKSCLGDEKVKN